MDRDQLAANMAIPLWRLQNLYSIKTEEDGRKIPFVPRTEQMEVLTSLIERPTEPLYIIKSRRLGMSTAIGLMMADCAAWNDGFQGSLVDQTQSDAERKMSEIMRFGIMSLPPEIVARYEFPKKNDGEIQVHLVGDPQETASRIFAGKSARGGTNNFLWVSEWGPISATDPTRSNEIRTGALPSARLGRRVVETTWYGGKGGDLWELVRPILEQDPNAMGRVLFFPWHGDPACVRVNGTVDAELEQYFRDLAGRLSRTFSQDQKRWYAAAKLEQGIFVRREYPSTLDEAMAAPVEGAIYGEMITRLRSEGSIKPFTIDGTALVHTFWDEGAPQNTATWYVQFCGGEIRIVDFDFEMDLTPVERVAHMKAKGYNFGNHYLTHAAEQTEKSGKTYQTQLAEAGLVNIRIVPRTVDGWVGINDCRQLLPRAVIHSERCERGVAALECYHTHPKTGDPVHDWSSHPADALRTMAEALCHGLVEGGSTIAKTARRTLKRAHVIAGIRDERSEMRSRVSRVLL